MTEEDHEEVADNCKAFASFATDGFIVASEIRLTMGGDESAFSKGAFKAVVAELTGVLVEDVVIIDTNHGEEDMRRKLQDGDAMTAAFGIINLSDAAAATAAA